MMTLGDVLKEAIRKEMAKGGRDFDKELEEQRKKTKEEGRRLVCQEKR